MPKVLVIRTLIIQSDQTDRKLRPVLHQVPQADKRDHVFIRFACTFFIIIFSLSPSRHLPAQSRIKN